MVLEKTCPECGRHLICRDGKYGEFLGCTGYPTCNYTERGADEERIYQPPSPYCEKCNHTGLIPFQKEGRIIPHTFIHCDCYEDGHENPYQLKPKDFDYPMSSSFYRALGYRYGWPDPGPDIPSEPKVDYEIDRLKAHLIDLERELNKPRDKKPASKAPPGYKGIK